MSEENDEHDFARDDVPDISDLDHRPRNRGAVAVPQLNEANRIAYEEFCQAAQALKAAELAYHAAQKRYALGIKHLSEAVTIDVEPSE